MSLVIVGSLALDSISTKAGSVKDALGGSAFYASIAASYFHQASIVGVVGDDYPPAGIELLRKHGVNLDGLETVSGKTFRWSGKYEDWNQADTLNTELNVFADFNPTLPPAYRNCRNLLLGNIHPSLQLQVLEQVESYDCVACDTMNYWITGEHEALSKVIGKMDVVFMNEEEVCQYTGCDNIFKAGKEILDMGMKLIVIKRGEYGSVCISDDYMVFMAAYPIEDVVDPTGAGDCFAGGFMGYLASRPKPDKQDIRNAALTGTVTAALNVSDFSVNGIANLDKQTIDAKIKQLKEWTS